MSNWVSDKQLLHLIRQLENGSEKPCRDDQVDNQEGSPCAWIQVIDGLITVTESGLEGHYPTITPIPPIIIKVNGQRIEGQSSVKPGDSIQWDVEEAPLYLIDISPDKMKAWFVLCALERYAPRIIDHAKTDQLVISAEWEQSVITDKVCYEDIVKHIQALPLPVFNSEAIIQELQDPSYVPVLIAKGKEPVLSRDASLELFFKENIENYFEEINGLVDYRNHLKIPSVKKGDMILRKIPFKQGEPGYDVFGNKLESPAPKDIILIGKQHVTVTPEHEAFAAKEGRPRITGDRIKMIDITTAHIVPGNVDLKTGNIVFSGDIIIYGDVTDGMIVEALGDVYIMGNLYRSIVTATGSVYIKGNIVGSKIYSGHYGVLFNRLYKCSTRLNEQFSSLRSVSKQLVEVAQSKGHSVSDKQVYQLLLDTKYKEVPSIVKEILSCISNIQTINKDQLSDLKDQLFVFAQPYHYSQVHIVERIGKLQMLLIETIESIRRCEENHVVTEINQCHLTEIMSNGDILIRKDGVLQSKLYSQGNIIFFDRGSVCRGSSLEADGRISAMNVGGMSGGLTILKAGKQIEVDLICEGRVIVDRFAKEILEPIENTRFFVKANRLLSSSTASEGGKYAREIG